MDFWTDVWDGEPIFLAIKTSLKVARSLKNLRFITMLLGVVQTSNFTCVEPNCYIWVDLNN